MKARRSLISRIASTFRKKKPVQKPRKSAKEPKSRGIEALEGRIAPAALIDASTVQFTEADGDIVTIHFSKPLFTKLASAEETITLNNLDNIFKFSGNTTFINDAPQDLQRIDLTKVKPIGTSTANPANGISFTIDAETPMGGLGDGLSKIGGINATGLTLGNVSIEGDLGQIDVGVASSKIALKSLTVSSLFANGFASQPTNISGNDALESKIVGGIQLLHVQGNLEGFIHVVDGNSIVGNSIKTTAPGNIGKVIVDGSLRGNATVAATSDNTGSINAQGTIGSVEVLGMGDDAETKGLIGGGGKNSGSIIASKKIGTITVKDSLVGGGGLNSGSIIGSASVSKVTVGDDIVGGVGISSGTIQGLSIKQVSVVDTIKGGTGDNSGSVTSSGLLSNITVKEIIGGNGKTSGGIRVDDLGKAAITGSVTGGAGIDSGVVLSDNGITSLVISQNIVGGTGAGSGGVLTNGLLKSVVVNGGITGGSVVNTGFIGSQSRIASVKVAGAVTGGTGDQSGRVYSAGSIDNVDVLKLVGGEGDGSGSILAASDPAIGGTIKSATIALGLQGGAGESSGTVISLNDIGKITIGTRLQPAGLVGGEDKFSGSIIAAGSIGKLKGKPNGILIYGSVEGGTGDQSGMIHAGGSAGLIEIRGGLTGEDGASGEESGIVRVDGQLKSLIVDAGLNNASVLVGADLVKAVIGSGVTDSTIRAFGAADPAVKTGDIAIGSLTVEGAVTGSQILAGYDQDGNGLNADASIKFVRVTGNWTASDLVAGVLSTDGVFGNSDDARIDGGIDRDGFIATIAKVQILGSIAGSADAGDHFGFVAEQITSFEASGTKLALTTLPGEVVEVPGTDDVTVREVTT
jgi:hypothetical protein